MNYLNLTPGSAPLVVKVSEGDIGREINFTLVEDGVPYTIPTGSTITCEILKSDGHGTSVPCTWSGSVVTFETTEQSTIRAGKATAELRIVNGADDIGTANFILAVEPRPINADTDQTDSSYSQTGDPGDVWTLGSNGVPSWSPSGLDASSATAGQAPIADGQGGWAWGDVQSGDNLTPAQKSTLIAVINAIGAFNVPNGQALINAFNSAWQETQPIPATGITLNRNTLSFNSAQAVILSATVTPSNTTDTVTWSTSNANVATVDGGAVVPVGNGSCTITASAGSVSATCAVTVNIESGEITFSQSGTTLIVSGVSSITSITQSGSTLALS